MVGQEAFQQMRQSLEKYNILDDEDWQQFRKHLKPKSYKKGDLFISEGQVCSHIGFLNNGIARVYYIIEGKEITSYFNADSRNIFVCSFTSFLTRKPSLENVHFLEDTDLLLLNYEALQELYDNRPNIQKLGRLMAEHNYVLSMERIYSLQYSPAVDRYNNMLKIYPGLLNRIPHHYIASYLGVTPESLSRIRKKAFE